MGCFLACFGSTGDRRRRRQRHKVQPRDQRNAGYVPAAESAVSLVQDHSLEPINSVSEISGKPEDQVGLNIRRKVTFDSNVKTFEHVPQEESVDFSLEKEDGVKREEKEENSVKPTQSQSSSEDSSITSSGSYPPNHRYQNCRDSDDELDYEESDIEDDDVDIDELDEDGDGLDYDDDRVVESRPGMPVDQVVTEEIDRSVVMSRLPERELKSSNNARDRSNYVHPVLNPVENLTQWKAVKARGTPQLRQQKQNLGLDQESRILSSSDLGFNEISFSFKEKSEQSRKSNQQIAVDASLSNWLCSSESTPINKPSTTGLDTTASEKSTLQGSNSPRSFEDRPILGALTMEEIKQLSASSSPRRSPSHSPDEIPIIGTVGTYWNHSDSVKASGAASSYKGIPNTTSKYREDKKVNWHSTPFEKRLERALNGGASGVYTTTGHTSNVC